MITNMGANMLGQTTLHSWLSRVDARGIEGAKDETRTDRPLRKW